MKRQERTYGQTFTGARKLVTAVLLAVLTLGLLSGCAKDDKSAQFSPQNPVTITVWHYYNGAILNAFDSIVQEFNGSIGKEKGIVVEGHNYGNVSELEKAVLASANKEVGSQEMPDIFASYADTAYEAEKSGILANLDDYFTPEEQRQYLDSYIEEGRIGLKGELRIFPIAKSTEVLLLNDTDWKPFAEANNLTYGDLATLEGLARVSGLYYDWTDAKTPDVLNDGSAFYGRDSIANMFIIASKEFGAEIFQVKDGKCALHVDATVMRKIWDCYYVPYISGHFASYGKFRSDDAKVGDILAYVGSTASASYFPKEVTVDEKTYPVEAKILVAPHFEGASKVMVQQGAGMLVTKSTQQEEAASVEFLKYFTDVDNNSVFSAMSGYMPVKKEAIEYDKLLARIQQKGQAISGIADATLKLAFEEMKTSELYTNKAFSGGTVAREVLDRSLQDKAVADREAVKLLMDGGMSRQDAVAQYAAEEHFQAWLESFTAALQAAIG